MAHGKQCRVISEEGWYIGEMSEGKKHGSGIMIDLVRGYSFRPEQQKFEGTWIDGLREGRGKVTIKDRGDDYFIHGFWKND